MKGKQKFNKTHQRNLEERRQQSIKRILKLSSEELEERKKKRRLYMRDRRAKESNKAREARLHQVRQHMAEIRASESEQDREARLHQVRQHMAEIRASESEQDREARLQRMRQHATENRASESEQDREARLQRMRQHATENRASESEQDREARLQQMCQHAIDNRASESEQDREARLQRMRQHATENRASESEQDREARLQRMRQHATENRASESEQDREARLQQMCQHAIDNRASESEQDREARLQRMRQHATENRASESEQDREARLQRMRQHATENRASESEQDREARLQQMCQHAIDNRASESEQDREARLQRMRQHATENRASESEQDREARLQRMRQHATENRASESEQDREARLQQMCQHAIDNRASESEQDREARLQRMRQHATENRASESEQDREARLGQFRQRLAESRNINRASITGFMQAINTFCDQICDVCTKRCYRQQISNWVVNPKTAPYLPYELKQRSPLIVCNRCKTHLSSKKIIAPSKSYWNNLDPGPIPKIIADLSQPEQRLISRIIPFVKIIKLNGLFGQYSFRGQAILFAQDVFEVTENLPNMLPRSGNNAGIVVITERLENIGVTRQFSISRQNVYDALYWLVANNPLYKDVVIDQNVVINDHDIIRLEEAPLETDTGITEEQVVDARAYIEINNASRIVRASWHQGNDVIFTSGFAGTQCCAMALTNILRACILSPQYWSTNILNQNLIKGHQIYCDIRFQTEGSLTAYPIAVDGYLLVRNFNIIKHNLFIFDRRFQINFDEEPSLYGSLDDETNKANLGLSLRQALESLFVEHNAGILISAGQSFGVMHYNDKYYFSNSHSCGPKGSRANNNNGKACVIECDNLDEFVRICKRTTGSKNIQFTLDFIDVDVFDMHDDSEEIRYHQVTERTIPTSKSTTPQQESVHQDVPLQTSLMAPIDVMQPNVEDELQISRNLNEITRKTKDNIVNVSHELKAEEFAWYFLFPYGKNGFKEQRPVTITALDYFQFRILGSDTRLQRNDYLFYALSYFEYYRVKSTISACGKKIVNQEGAVEDVHLYIKNLRGSAAYWRSALNELLAQIKCLGAPTYFVTFSSNDLNWLDQRKALLIADDRPDVDPSTIDIYETQRLIEKYPVILSRHFMIRVNALMKFIKNNNEVFSGKVKDYWWRIEFQNRGSPHLHMVIWIDNHPEFDTEEGKLFLDRNCCCKMPSEEEDPELFELVKKCQVHRHTPTCTKNNTSVRCRFNFPRQECAETKIVSHSSDDFLRNGGRICLLKRRKEDAWVNNYHPELLKLWTGNMDIQPCGSNEAIAYYIAKYLSKAEPEGVDSGIAQAIQQIQREETDLSRKLFRICMKILHERQVSAAECAYRLCHIPLRDSSRKCIFVNTRKPEQRYRVLQFDRSGHATGYYTNIFERYEKRPLQHPDYDFANMSLIEYAMLFEPFYPKKVSETEENVDHDVYEEQPNMRRSFITLLDETKMVVRSVPAVVRVPYFITTSDSENFFYSLLIQYMPYRSEIELLEGFDSAKEAFLARENRLKEISRHMHQHRERDQQLENAFNQVHAFEILEQPEIINPDAEEEELPDIEMSNYQFQRLQQAMNTDQRQLFVLITESIKNQLDGDLAREKIFITGGAGTGKTFLFNLLKNQVNRCYGKSVVKVGALTGVAARLVGGTTLHRLLKLPVQKDGVILNMPLLTGNYLKVMRQLWQDVEFLFIDEISMVPYEMLCMIDSRLRQLKNSNVCFGGINMLLFGDLMQLPPVRGHQVFQQPEHMKPATHLWRLFRLVELKQNMRQQGDTTFIDVLNALRVGELNAKHLDILLGKVSTETCGEFSIERALRIYPTNDQVARHNEKVLQSFEAKGTFIYTIKAQDQLIDATRNLGTKDLASVVPSDINKTGGLPNILKIFVGSKVMLRSNIDLSKGLVNGNMGIITEIMWPNYRRGQVYAEDIPSVRIDFGSDGLHIIKPISIQFPAKYSYGTVERRMLPLILSWASTVHKMQGCTVDHAVIYLGPRLFADGQAYVALSRGRTLNGIQIEELDCSKLTGRTPCNIRALDEMNRLRNNNL